MSRDLSAGIRNEQIEVLYRQARIVFLPNAIASPAIVLALWDRLPHGELITWLVLMYAVTIGRSALVWMHERRKPAAAQNARWGWMLACANAVSGTLWGACGFLFVPHASPMGLAFIMVCVAAMVSGAVSSLSAFGPAYLVFAIPAAVPLITRLLIEWLRATGAESINYLLLAILTLVYLTVHLVFSRNTERTLVESIRLRFEKLDLVEELTRAKERAEAASLAKSRFLAAASHDLRQPMHALGLFIDALRSETHASHAARLVESVTESHQAATSLLDNLLEFSKVDAGITEPQLDAVPVQRLLDQVRAEYSIQASAADLELRVHPCRLWIRTDAVLLARMLGNLVSNAIRYTEEGRIVVGCRRARGALRIEVHDTGIGIPATEHAAIFREFYQVAAGARRGRRSLGMGLGLAIVAGLADALDHPVAVASTPAKGSVFAVTVPLARPIAVASEQAPSARDELRGRCILVIDDEHSIRDAVAEVLRRWGCRTIAASDARQALALMAASPPDAMVVDYQLADGASGLDAIAAVEAALGRRVPAVIVTGDTRPERLREAGEIGYLLLYKPLAPMRLRAALGAILQARVEPAPVA